MNGSKRKTSKAIIKKARKVTTAIKRHGRKGVNPYAVGFAVAKHTVQRIKKRHDCTPKCKRRRK